MDTFGAKTDPAILLIHGAGNNRFAWPDEFCTRLADGGRFVIRYDFAGASVDALAEDALRRFDDAHVVGLSLGGLVGLRLALDHPERVHSLTLLSTTPGGDGLPDSADGLFDDLPEPPDWSDRAAVVEFLVESERPFSPRFDEPATRAYAERVADDPSSVRTFIEAPFDWGEPMRARLGTLRTPTLVIHGAQDPVFPLEHGETLAREIPGAALLVLPETGHEYPPRRHWDTVVSAILRHTNADRGLR
ncbi:alpha/beta hydrolase [Solirubrobacter sp. CPCC 204708]|uniref:Alpha/beta fold hydrolase n=1 Tax=Solirubrobacter deserti TaxID=2282478 RepID=A0ABT4RJN7_9ACTN|nr:alpha/beta hydrolase [Solirubrobacter deserti]MBE2319746.1 alpha/beta hydrolase [Solirubrobacter deserti]MDA0138773.1 alpha/beta fold hydrolase [Solirubrobacter deserti]